MSTYGGSTRSSGSSSARAKRFSNGTVPTPPGSQGSSSIPPAPSSVGGQENIRPRNMNVQGAYGRSHGPAGKAPQQHPQSINRHARPSTQKESVMARNRHVRAPTAVDTEDAVTVLVSIVGVKFQCLVEKEWPCESLVASAIAEYHLAYPTCEVPDCSIIHHVGRKENLVPRDPVGKWCREGDEIELIMKERPMQTPADQPPRPDDGLQFHTYDFTVVFHRLPLGFTLKQEMDATVVANIYPKSAATHYTRLVPGAIVVKIGDTPLEFLGLRQVHEVIRNCKLPLPIRFRGWKKPVARRASFSGLCESGIASPRIMPVVAPAPSSEPLAALAQRRKSVPAPPPPSKPALDDTASNSGSSRSKLNAETSAAAAAGVPELFSNSVGEVAAPMPSPYSQSKQKLSTERKKTNASSPYPEHRAVAAERRTARSTRGSPVGGLMVPLADQLDALSNQGGSPDGSPASVADLKLEQKEYHLVGAPLDLAHAGSINSVTHKLASTTIGEATREVAESVSRCDVDSNQNEEETEEMLVEHIKILQAELVKKHEEAKLLTNQLETYHARLSSIQRKRERRTKRPSATPPPSTTTGRPATAAVAAPTPKLTLTPEILEAMDTKSGLPAKNLQYAGSNASSVSGYSNYSSRSAMAAKRHSQQLSRFVGKTGGDNSGRGDASVSSFSSAYRRERSGSISYGDGGLKSPRRQAVQNNVANRYNFMPAKYAGSSDHQQHHHHQYEPPSSFSTKGGLISRAKITRDSYIKIADTPGVGAYDVKLPQERVRGGEIGDSDRSLPWP